MGAIQNSLNQVVGTAIGAGAAIKHSVEKKEAAEDKKALDAEQGLLAKEQYHEARAESTRLEGESKIAGETLGKASEMESGMKELADATINNPNASDKAKAKAQGLYNKALTDKDAAQRAFDELADKIEAKKAIMSRAEAIMKRTNTWGGMR